MNIEKYLFYRPTLPDANIENVFLTEEAETLAQNYVDDGVVVQSI